MALLEDFFEKVNFDEFFFYIDLSCLLKTFANNLDSDQARQNVGPDVDPNCSTPERFILKKVNLKKSVNNKKHA